MHSQYNFSFVEISACESKRYSFKFFVDRRIVEVTPNFVRFCVGSYKNAEKRESTVADTLSFRA